MCGVFCEGCCEFTLNATFRGCFLCFGHLLWKQISDCCLKFFSFLVNICSAVLLEGFCPFQLQDGYKTLILVLDCRENWSLRLCFPLSQQIQYGVGGICVWFIRWHEFETHWYSPNDENDCSYWLILVTIRRQRLQSAVLNRRHRVLCLSVGIAFLLWCDHMRSYWCTGRTMRLRIQR